MTVFRRGGSLEVVLTEAQIPLTCLNKGGRWDLFRFFFRFIVFVRRCRPQILHSYLGTPNLLASFAKLIHPAVIVVWGVRGSYRDMDHYDWASAFTQWIEGHLSRWPDLILVNSYAGLGTVIERGFPREKIRVIQNGIDSDRFQPDVAAGTKLRKEWGIAESEKLVGRIGRLDPMKDHATFLKGDQPGAH